MQCFGIEIESIMEQESTFQQHDACYFIPQWNKCQSMLKFETIKTESLSQIMSIHLIFTYIITLESN